MPPRRLLPFVLVAALAACSSPTAPAPAEVAPPAPAPAPAPGPRGTVVLDDMDRTADPCTDFYQYANGTWRANNPIPASMDRWSRRWQAGENNKQRLTEILDEVSKRTDWPSRSIEQQIGDLYLQRTLVRIRGTA